MAPSVKSGSSSKNGVKSQLNRIKKSISNESTSKKKTGTNKNLNPSPRASLQIKRYGQNPINSIPDEMLLEIFSYLSPSEIIRSVAPLCKRTLRISRDHTLWKNLEIIGDLEEKNEGESNISNEKLSRAKAKWLIDRALPHMRQLVIKERSDASQLVSYATRHGNQLTSLVLRRISGPMPATVLLRAIKKLGGLRKLVLRDVRKHKSTLFFRQLGIRLPHLTVLDVGHCPQFGTAALRAVADSGLSLKELRAYREHGRPSTLPHASNVDFMSFCHHMKDTITVLKINAASLSDLSCVALSQCVHLRTLHLRNANQLTERGITMIARHLKNLVSLDLSGAIMVPSESWTEVFSEMTAAPVMEILILSDCSEVGTGVMSLIGTHFHSLKHLNISGCYKVEEIGFSGVVLKCKHLHYLNIKGLFSSNWRCLELLPLHTQKLETLVLSTGSHTNLVALLTSQMPQLKILDEDEPKRLAYWRNVSSKEELIKLLYAQENSLFFEEVQALP